MTSNKYVEQIDHLPKRAGTFDHVSTRAMDEEDLYDEFGNYIGPAVPDDEDDDDDDEDNDLEDAFAARYF